MLNHVETFKAGESGYYNERARGTVIVEHDSTRYVYRKPSGSVRKFKYELLAAFGDRCTARISGQYPCYRIETEC